MPKPTLSRSARLQSAITGAIGVVLAGMTPGCVQTETSLGPDVQRGATPEKPATPGISGKPPTPAAQPGQSLPLQPARTIAFETDEGTMLSLDVAPDGQTIVFDMLGDIYLLGIEGGVARRLTQGLALDTQPVFSPDGDTVLFLSDRSGAENLWLMNADGSRPRQLSFHDDNPVWASPEWSPDGESIIASRFWPDRNAYELWQFETGPGAMGEVLRTTDPTTAKDSPVSSLGAGYAPDGKTIYTASLRSETAAFDTLSAWKIIAYDLQTGREDEIAGSAQRPAFRPRVSPDGRQLAYAERRGNETWLQLHDLSGGTTRTLAQLDPDSLQASLWHDAVPRFDFTPDGTAIIANAGGKIRRFSLASGTSRDIPFDAQVEKALGPLVRTQIPLENGPVKSRLIMSPAWSPDGQTVAFSALGHVYTRSLEPGSEPQRLLEAVGSTYHPSWSADGKQIALVSWTREDGGQVWITSPEGGKLETVSTGPAFFTHPVFTPDGAAIIAVRSTAEGRNTTYMEFGQLRAAELVYMPLDGSPSRILTSGRIGGTPHFGPDPDKVFINTEHGVEAISIETGDPRIVTQAEGPNWYFAEGPAKADDLRVSPDGRWALAQITQQLHLYELPDNDGTSVTLSQPDTRHVQLTDIGADYFAWSTKGDAVLWSVGSTVYRLPMSDVSFPDRGKDHPVPVEQTYEDRHDIVVSLPRQAPGAPVLLHGATVIPMTDRENPGRVMPNADILVRNGKIVSVGPAGEVKPPEGIARIDLSGTYVIPGLIDAHYHVADIRRDVLQFDVWGLKTNLAYGVTTLFDPSSLSIDMLAYQDLIATGDVAGSRLFSTGPAVFDFNDFRSRAEVDAVLRRYRDHYRIRNLKQYRTGNRRVRQWFAQSARDLSMTPTTEGALSFKLGLTHILDGYSGNEHALPPPVLHRDVTELFARSNTSSTLTLMITHGGVPADEHFIARRNPGESEKYARFAPDWFMEREFDQVEARQEDAYLYRAVASSAHRIHEAGGVVGLGAHGDIPGLGTLWEIEAYVDGGWSPAEALWAATMGNARTIARDESLGSLLPGKAADLVVLEASPLEDIRAIEAVRAVMKNGHFHDGDTLEESALTLTEQPH
ncbi:amidohydrolase family protein [Henriciella sp.]|uniref:amidohydrolase family protein n=1 Tax=Henriciella sp. TaxID=1968823 RepID=UPI00263973BD|nr:amidohydrolase family protein [Henriciella sp.]